MSDNTESKPSPRIAAAKLARQVEVNDIKALMANKGGRRFMRRLLGEAGVFRTSFTANDAQTNFNEGRRSVGLQFLSEVIEHTPDDYIQMLTESKPQ